MNILSSSQNQSSSQFPKQEEQPDLQSLLVEIQLNKQLDPESASKMASKVSMVIKKTKNQQFQACLNIVAKLIEKGYTRQVSKHGVILQAMMDGFTNMARAGDISGLKIMSLLSVIAEIIKQAPQVQISIKKKFLQCLILIDQQVLQASPIRKEILAVLGVLYDCISRHAHALKKFQLLNQFKKAILSNYSLIEQHFSCRLFNKALYNLAVQGQPITEAQLAKYGIFATLSKILGSQLAIAAIGKIKSALQKLHQNNKAEVAKRSEMVAQS